MSNQITSFDDNITKQVFMARFNKLATDLAKEMGVEIDTVRNINSNYNLLTFNVAFSVKKPKPQTKTTSTVFGTGPIKKEEVKIGFKFRLRTHVFTVSGFNYKNWKNNVSMLRDDGKRFKTNADTIVKLGKRV